MIPSITLDEGIEIREVPRTNKEEVQKFCDLVNDLSPVSWKLTPQKLLLKMGKLGAIYALYNKEEMIGTIAIKEVLIEDYKAGEINYIYIHRDYKTVNNMLALFYHAIDDAKRFDLLFLTTVKKDLGITKLFDRSQSKIKFAFAAKLKVVSTIVNFWIAVKSNGKLTLDERVDLLKSRYGESIVEDSPEFDN